MGDEITPFRIEVPAADIEDLGRRIEATRWPDQIPGSGWDYGADMGAVRALAEYWADGFDWRKQEAALNEFPQFLATIDGQQIHFVHVRSPEPDAQPLILTHGWPGSFCEFRHMIGPLTDPVAHGADAADAFHVVIPSLPGYGFSGPTTEPGWDVARTARTWATLMARLGYERYGAQGGDWGSMVTRHLAVEDAEHVVGFHVNMIMVFPPGEDDDMAELTEREQAGLDRMNDYFASGNGYAIIQGSKPQSLAYALVDSAVGQLAWIAEKFQAWTDHDGSFEDVVSRDDFLTNVSIYWFTGTAGSSARMYFESLATGSVFPPSTTVVPLGVADFRGEILHSRRAWVARENDLVHWAEYERGGHFAAMEQPDALTSDIRTFFRTLRG